MTIEYPHITTNPEVSEGRPCIADTGVRVTDVFTAADAGTTIKGMQTRFPGRELTFGEVHAALGYYHDNRDELEARRLADEKAAAESERERLAAIKRRFMGE